MEDINDLELDDILDRALEEFEEEELNKISQDAAASAGLGAVGGEGGQTVDSLLKEQQVSAVTTELHKMINDLDDPVHAEVDGCVSSSSDD